MKFVCVAMLVLGFSTPAAAWLNTAELQSVCEAGLSNPVPENPRYEMCAGLVIGILTADDLEKDVICVPSDIETKTALEAFIARASSEPHKEIEGTVTLYRALAEKYPCATK
jgi:Ssp1 endopeptidase immunity protein Rap1a